MTIWQFNRQVSSRLLQINIVNMMLGQRLLRYEGFWKGVGTQAVAWSSINIAIAFFGNLFTRRRLDKLENPFEVSVVTKEAVNLRRVLWINTGLDVLYMVGGLILARTRGKQSAFARSNGMGIVLQGLLLFVFDLVHALRVPMTE